LVAKPISAGIPAAARRAAPRRVVDPLLGQVEPPCDRQAGPRGGQRQADRDLTVVLLADLTAVLPGDAERMPTLLGDAGVVEDPGVQRAAAGGQPRQHPIPHRGEHGPVIPGCLGDEVVHRLVRGADAPRGQLGRHRLDALALARQQQAGAIRPQRAGPVGVPERLRKALDIGQEARFPVRHAAGSRGHEAAPCHRHTVYDTVVL
jgi:hypothetical protein